MTREELREIFDEAEQKVRSPEVYSKLIANFTDSENCPPADEAAFSIRVNQVLEREILYEVLARVLGA